MAFQVALHLRFVEFYSKSELLVGVLVNKTFQHQGVSLLRKMFASFALKATLISSKF